MIGAGDRAPGARVWFGADDREGVSLQSLADDGPYLLLFYLYDWTST